MATVHIWSNKICLNNKHMLTLTYFNIIKEIRWALEDLQLVFFILGNSADHNEMSPYAAFHLGLHCLPKYLHKVRHNSRIESSRIKRNNMYEKAPFC